MKVYIAGPLCDKENRKFLEKLDKICKEAGFETFLPHSDAGLFTNLKDVERISKRDIEELHKSDLLIGVLDGIYVGAGTAWEMGYAQAIGKKVIGLKTDRKVDESIADISVVIAGSVYIIESLEELKKELKNFMKINQKN